MKTKDDRTPSADGDSMSSETRPPASLASVPIFRRGRGDESDGSGPPPGRGSRTARTETAKPRPPVPRHRHPRSRDAIRNAGAPSQRTFRDLRHYWRWLAHGDRPDIDMLDGEMISRSWPHAMLIRIPQDGFLDIVRVFAPVGSSGHDTGRAEVGHPLDGDRASQVSSWVLALARGTAAGRRPEQARESFQFDNDRKTYVADLLPCMSNGDSADYVLLNVRES